MRTPLKTPPQPPNAPSSILHKTLLTVSLFAGIAIIFAIPWHHSIPNLNHVADGFRSQRATSPTACAMATRASQQCVKTCNLVVMIIASEKDRASGITKAYSNAFPVNDSRIACCVFIYKSPDLSHHFKSTNETCDEMHVPMVRSDTYRNIAEKVRSGIVGVPKFYKYNWLMKADTDSFLCIARIHAILRNFDPRGMVYLGHPLGGNDMFISRPETNLYNPTLADIWKNPNKLFENSTQYYHPYMSGAGYLISRSVVEKLGIMMPYLMFATMEDTMLGSWMLGLQVHRSILLGFRAVYDCDTRRHHAIVHGVKGEDKLNECVLQNPSCRSGQVANENDPTISDISFVMVTNTSARLNQLLQAYSSLRNMFPYNEVIIGDNSKNGEVVKSLARLYDDANAITITRANMSFPLLRNKVVSMATKPYVCVMEDQHLPSWETFIARMLDKVSSGELDIASGYLIPNPIRFDEHVNQTRYGYNFTVSGTNALKSNNNDSEVGMKYPHNDGGDFVIKIGGTTGFYLAKRSLLEKIAWGDFGPFADDVWHLRLLKRGVKIGLVNSGVRCGFHYRFEGDYANINEDDSRRFVQRACRAMGRLGITRMGNQTELLSCANRTFEIVQAF